MVVNLYFCSNAYSTFLPFLYHSYVGLGKTLQSVALIYTLLKTGITANGDPTCKRVIVVCPCSLVKNWENEFVKWLGPNVVKTLALAEADRKTVEKNLDCFVKTKLFNVLICSYECLRAHVGRLKKYQDCCDLLVCDEAHRLKNSENQTSKALHSLPVKKRVLLTGTPMQNDLQEFYAMVDFTNPGVLGTQEEFRKNMLFPILRGREPDATDAQKRKRMDIQNDMSTTVNEFILRRINTLNAEHLPPKLVQVVCCNLTGIQQNMYQHLVTSKESQHALEGKQVNCLGSIQMLMKLCNHPSLLAEEDPTYGTKQQQGSGRRAAAKQVKYTDDDHETQAAPGADGIGKFLPMVNDGGRGNNAPVHPEWSGKMFVLFRLMKEMRRPGNGNDKIVIVSNYTQTLDLIGRMCRQNSWGFCRLDGSITMKKRQKMVDEFNDPSTPLIAFLLSSKAGGCGLNLIGGNRLVLFDPGEDCLGCGLLLCISDKLSLLLNSHTCFAPLCSSFCRLESCCGQAGGSPMLARRPEKAMLYLSIPRHWNSGRKNLSTTAFQGGSPVRGRRQGTSERPEHQGFAQFVQIATGDAFGHPRQVAL
jgi:DNA repair and recombination RAD54-like protein